MNAIRLVSAALDAAGVYLAGGVAFAIAFHVRGMRRVDPATRGAGVGFRLLVTPGIVALWPVLAARWARAVRGAPVASPPDPSPGARRLRAGHRALARAVALLAAIGVSAAVVLREPRPEAPPPAPDVASLESGETLRFGDLPIRAEVVADPARGRALRIAVAGDLGLPPLALTLVPAGADEPRVLGTVWGPADLRFALPEDAARGGGLALVETIGGEVVARSDLPPTDR